VAEQYLGLCDERTVDPVFGGGAAGLADDGTQVALGEAHTVGVIGDLMLLAAMLVDKPDKAIEDGLFA